MNPLALRILCSLLLVGCGGTPFEAGTDQAPLDTEAGASSGGATGGEAGGADAAFGGAAGDPGISAGAGGARAEGGASGETAVGAGATASGGGAGAPTDPNLWLGAPCNAPSWKAGVPYINPDIVTARCVIDVGACVPGELVAFICGDAECAQHKPDGSKGTHWTARQRCGS
jgi:hypothetical protein